MKFTSKIIQLIIGGAVGGTVALNLLLIAIDSPAVRAEIVQLTQALSPEEINLRTKQIIVRIDGASVGSGSIIEYSDNAYTVLTNWHVMKNQGQYFVQTIDGRKHEVMPATIKQLPGLDLAVFQFTSNQNYQTGELGDSSNLSEGQNVYFAGYPGELRREDNRYYRFFTANLVGILPKSTENGYSLIYNGEAFPGMSGGPVLSKDGLIIGIHGEANIHALSGGTSNYAIPINNYRQAIAKLKPQPIAKPLKPLKPLEPLPTTPTTASKPTTLEANNAPTPQPEADSPPKVESPATVETETIEISPTPPEVVTNEQPDKPESTSESIDSDNISSVPTFSSQPSSGNEPETETKPEIVIEPETVKQPVAAPETVKQPEVVIETETIEQPVAVTKPKPEPTVQPKQPQVATKPEATPTESEEIDVPTVTRRIPLVSKKTGIDYTKLRNLLREKKWSEADIHTYRLIEQVVKSAKQQNKHIFIELKTIAEFSCPDIRTVDYLWRKYSDAKFGFSPQQEIWQSVNQKGDFSTQTWRRFATEVGWKKGEVASGSGYLLYEQLDFEPTNAPAGHLPWWFALPDEEQKVIKYLFARCNLNPTEEELEAEAQKNSPDTAQNPDNNRNRSNNNQTDRNKAPK